MFKEGVLDMKIKAVIKCICAKEPVDVKSICKMF